MSALSPPSPLNHEYEDAGTHEMASSDSDHFSSASEGRNPRKGGHSHTASDASTSPVPITRVERVDDEPRHGEVPNTEAYEKRSADAVPDEVEIIPDGQRSRASSRLRPEDRPHTPGGSPVPKMIVEKIDPDTPAYGDVPGTEAYEKRKADAVPDEIIKSPAGGRTTNPWNVSSRSPVNLTTAEQTQSENDWDTSRDAADGGDADDEEEEGFGEDFDDFAEGEEAADDDFGDFDDGIDAPTAEQPAPTPSLPAPQSAIPTPNLRGLSQDEIQAAIKPYMDDLFPPNPKDIPDSSTFQPQTTPFLTDRSLSLWSQLVAPPSIQPPNWTRSHIRRLFLVSIGVPLDLDEVLPRSTQKKLILPSFDHAGRSPRTSTEGLQPVGAADRLRRQHTNGSDSSLASTASAVAAKEDRRRKRETLRGPPPPPVWDASAARLLAGRTQEAMKGMTDEELKGHVDALFESERVGRECLRYWEGRAAEAGREKEAFEGVIENLVKHARNVRK